MSLAAPGKVKPGNALHGWASCEWFVDVGRRDGSDE
jgi:hypothetical protein